MSRGLHRQVAQGYEVMRSSSGGVAARMVEGSRVLSSSNTPLVDPIARKTVLGTNSLCAALNYCSLAVSGLIEVIDEWYAWPLAERSDQHDRPVQPDVRW